MDTGDAPVSPHETSFQKLHDALHQDQWYKPILEKLEKVTGVKREYIVIGILVLFAFNLMMGVGGQIICHAVGLLYPAAQTIQVIQSKNNEMSFRWLMYWIVFCSLNFVEVFTTIILNFIPFYWLIKCSFLVWCFSSMRNNGSVYMYQKVIYPVFSNIPSNAHFIDDMIETAATIQAGAERNLRSRRRTPK